MAGFRVARQRDGCDDHALTRPRPNLLGIRGLHQPHVRARSDDRAGPVTRDRKRRIPGPCLIRQDPVAAAPQVPHAYRLVLRRVAGRNSKAAVRIDGDRADGTLVPARVAAHHADEGAASRVQAGAHRTKPGALRGAGSSFDEPVDRRIDAAPESAEHLRRELRSIQEQRVPIHDECGLHQAHRVALAQVVIVADQRAETMALQSGRQPARARQQAAQLVDAPRSGEVVRVPSPRVVVGQSRRVGPGVSEAGMNLYLQLTRQVAPDDIVDADRGAGDRG